MERVLGFGMDDVGPGDDAGLVTWRGHGLVVTLPAKLAEKEACVAAVIHAARREGSIQRAAAIREALGLGSALCRG